MEEDARRERRGAEKLSCRILMGEIRAEMDSISGLDVLKTEYFNFTLTRIVQRLLLTMDAVSSCCLVIDEARRGMLLFRQ